VANWNLFVTDALHDSGERERIRAWTGLVILALWFVVCTANELHHIRSQALDVILCMVTVAGFVLCLLDYVRRSSTRYRSARACACDPFRFTLLPIMFLFGVGLTQWLVRASTGGMQEYLDRSYLVALPWGIAGYLRYRHSIRTYGRKSQWAAQDESRTNTMPRRTHGHSARRAQATQRVFPSAADSWACALAPIHPIQHRIGLACGR